MNKRKIPTGDEWWYQEPYRTHGPLSDWFDIEAILAEQRRRIVGGIEMLKNGKNSGQVDAKLLEQRERIAETVKGLRLNTERNERYNCVTCEGDTLSCDCEAKNSMLDAVIEKLKNNGI